MVLTLGILILVCALFLIISVLLQSSKNHRMSGVVSGGAETFFGKQKGKTIDAALSKATTIIAIIFAVLVLVLYAMSANENKENNANSQIDLSGSNPVVDQLDDEGATGDETAAPEVTPDANPEDAQ